MQQPSAPYSRPIPPPRAHAGWFTPAFNRYIRPAQSFPSIWRTFLALLTGFLVYVLGVMAVFYAFARWVLGVVPQGAGLDPAVYRDILQGQMIPLLEAASTPKAMALMLSSFIPLVAAVWVMARMHRRGLRSLLGPRAGFANGFGKAFMVIALLNLPLVGLAAINGNPGHIQNLALSAWLLNLSWALPLIAVQTGSEELVFRGYLQQQLAVRARNPLVWMLVPSVLFGLGHANPDATLSVQAEYVVWATAFGLIAADLTRVTGNLGAAIGFHFANNMFVMVWVASPNHFGGLALFRLAPGTAGAAPPFWAELFYLLIIWALARHWLRRDTGADCISAQPRLSET